MHARMPGAYGRVVQNGIGEAYEAVASVLVVLVHLQIVTHSVKMSQMSPNALLSYGQFNVGKKKFYFI